MPQEKKMSGPSRRFVSLFICGSLLAALTVMGMILFPQPTPGSGEVASVTQRLATAIAQGDQATLEKEPLLQGRPDAVAFLMKHVGIMKVDPYRVGVCQNGVGGRRLGTPETVTHLGLIETAKREVWLGFHFDLETSRLRLVSYLEFVPYVKPR